MVRWRQQLVTVLTCACTSLALCNSVHATDFAVSGFDDEQVRGGWTEAVGITFAADGTPFVWERQGRVYMQHDGEWHEVIDIAEEVGGWRDFGLLGFALHPNFLNNGQVFLMYVVDRHHLLYFGTKDYDAGTNWYFEATQGRITRYTLDPKDDFHSIVPDSRLVLVGESIGTGFPILHESHGTGSLVFGTDGTLLAACGDGASYNTADTGGTVGGSYAELAEDEGIILPKENIGAFRSQLIDSHNGKVIRIDPDTGDGLQTNPHFDPAFPRKPKSRVWALGLRNPCRMTLRPGTGSHDPDDGNPGVLYIGDVGWGTWEDLNVCTGPSQNFGWPLYEGLTSAPSGYTNPNIANQDAPNPLFGQGGCNQQYFYFKNLLKQDTLTVDPFFANPCNGGVEIPDSIPKFIHRRPEIDWGRPNGPARTGIFSGNNAAVINVGAQNSPVQGPQFGGNCSIGGVFYTGTSYPAQFHNTYFHAEYGTKWIKSIVFDGTQNATLVQNFATSGGDIVSLGAHPITGEIYYVRWNQVWRVYYSPSGNQAPTAIASSSVSYGDSPLTVQFTGSASTDPEQQALQYNWNFGDGTPNSNQANPQHTFNAPAGVPTQFNATLTVTDNGSLTSQDALIISVNNTPPQVSIVSPVDGSKYPMTGPTVYSLVANIDDAEHDAGDLDCSWQVVLHHNQHDHPEPPDSTCSTTATLTPAGCDGNLYFYRITLLITDAAGLVASDFVDIYPDCDGNQAPTANGDTGTVLQYGQVELDVLTNDSDTDGTLNPATVAIIEPPSHGTATLDPTTGILTYSHNGDPDPGDMLAYTVNDADGGTSNIANVIITVEPVIPGDVNGDAIVNVDDLLGVIAAWGPCPSPPDKCPADVSPIPGGDGVVNVNDLLVVINNWG